MADLRVDIALARHMVDVLNDALGRDFEAIRLLIEHRMPCNDALTEHPTIQVDLEQICNTKDTARLVPQHRVGMHSKSSGYKAFRRALETVGIENKTLHATRNTFVSIARSNGAPVDVIESVTHNAKGQVIDDYTTFEWLAVCRAVALFDVTVDPNRTRAFLELQRQDSNRGEQTGKRWNRRDLTGNDGSEGPQETGANLTWGALFDARQRRLLNIAEVDPEAARPGLAVCRGLEAAYRGDGPATVEALREAAEALGMTAGGRNG